MSKEEPVYISTRQLRYRYGGVSHMWIERRLADDPEFPKPVYFGGRRFWRLTAVEVWERTTAAKSRLRQWSSEPNPVAPRKESAQLRFASITRERQIKRNPSDQ